MWGSNIPLTRTPDAHFMTEARYRGQKVVTVSPDYTDNTKFADEWVAPHPGTDGALALAMGHVILTEYFVQRRTARFEDYMRRFTDAPYLVTLESTATVPRARQVPHRQRPRRTDGRGRARRVQDRAARPTAPLSCPNGSLGHRFTPEDEGHWNLDLGDVVPPLSIADLADTDGVGRDRAPPLRPRARRGPEHAGGPASSVAACPCDASPAARHDRLRPAARPVRRRPRGAARRVADRLRRREHPRNPGLAGGDHLGARRAGHPHRPRVRRQRRALRRPLDDPHGRAGTNHWFHSDTIYRTFLALTTITGCQGINGGGWAHYVGQEKVPARSPAGRPVRDGRPTGCGRPGR